MADQTMHWNQISQNAPGLTGFLVAVLVKFPGVNSIQLKNGKVVLSVLLQDVDEDQQAAFTETLTQHKRVMRQWMKTYLYLPDVQWQMLKGFSQLQLSWSLEQFVPKQVQLVFELLWNQFDEQILAEEFVEDGDELVVKEGFLEEQLKGAQWNTSETLIAYRDGGRVLVYSVPALG